MESTGNVKNAGNLCSPRPAVRKEDKNNINTSGGVRRSLKLGEHQTDANSIVPAVRKEGKIKFTIRRGQEEPQTGGTSVPAVRKGVALATQTVVLLVLAAIVLGSILIFFMNIFNPQEKGFTSISKQTTLCQQYIRYAPECDCKNINPSGSPPSYTCDGTNELVPGPFDFSKRNELRNVCYGLGFQECRGDDLTPQCIKQCCANFCG